MKKKTLKFAIRRLEGSIRGLNAELSEYRDGLELAEMRLTNLERLQTGSMFTSDDPDLQKLLDSQ